MKKFIALLCVSVLLATNVEARPMRGHHHHGGPRPVAVHYVHNDRHNNDIAVAGITVGIVGLAAIFNAILSNN